MTTERTARWLITRAFNLRRTAKRRKKSERQLRSVLRSLDKFFSERHLRKSSGLDMWAMYVLLSMSEYAP